MTVIPKYNTTRLRTLNGAVGRFKVRKVKINGKIKTVVDFVDRNGRSKWKDLKKWEIKAAKFYNPK